MTVRPVISRLVTFAMAVAVVVGLGLGTSSVADPGPAAQRRAQIKKRIQALRAAEITTDLDLDAQTAAKLTAVLNKYDDETDALVQKRVELTHKLQNVDAKTSSDVAQQLVDDAVANAKAFRDLEDRRFGELRKLLTPQQSAKLLVVLPEFERRIQNQLKNAIQGANSPKKPPRDDLDERE